MGTEPAAVPRTVTNFRFERIIFPPLILRRGIWRSGESGVLVPRCNLCLEKSDVLKADERMVNEETGSVNSITPLANPPETVISLSDRVKLLPDFRSKERFS